MMKEYNINQTTLRILGLYRGDYTKSLHLREIARGVKVDVKAVQLQMKRLKKINVILDALKGRNREYYLNLNNQITKYHMILAEAFASIIYLSENFVIKKVVSEVGEKVEGSIILFGSFAKGQVTPDSDIDILVLAEGELNRNAFSEAGRLVNREINVKRMRREQFLEGLEEGDPLVREVVSDHVVLKGVDDFCDVVWRYYAKR